MAVWFHMKQIFNCFVCGTGGNVFKFVMLYHKMSKWRGAADAGAAGGGEVAGVAARRQARRPEKDKDGLTPRERIANTNEWACAWFEKQLRTPQGKAGLLIICTPAAEWDDDRSPNSAWALRSRRGGQTL